MNRSFSATPKLAAGGETLKASIRGAQRRGGGVWRGVSPPHHRLLSRPVPPGGAGSVSAPGSSHSQFFAAAEPREALREASRTGLLPLGHPDPDFVAAPFRRGESRPAGARLRIAIEGGESAPPEPRRAPGPRVSPRPRTGSDASTAASPAGVMRPRDLRIFASRARLLSDHRLSGLPRGAPVGVPFVVNAPFEAVDPAETDGLLDGGPVGERRKAGTADGPLVEDHPDFANRPVVDIQPAPPGVLVAGGDVRPGEGGGAVHDGSVPMPRVDRSSFVRVMRGRA